MSVPGTAAVRSALVLALALTASLLLVLLLLVVAAVVAVVAPLLALPDGGRLASVFVVVLADAGVL
jgi:hypothetical protein